MAATATARTTAPARRRSAPAKTKRRRSGHTPSGGFVPVAAAAGAVGGLADSGLFVWLTRGRLWIGLLGTLLVGIVGLNVMALSFSASSSNAGQAADVLKRQNSALRAQIAGKLSNSEIQAVAAKLGLVMPAAGSIGYLSSSADDAKTAAQRLRNGELTIASATVPAALVETATVTTAPVDTATVTTDPATTTDPAVAATDTTVAPPAETTATPVTTAGTTTGGAVGAP
jgi:hypothetical protein